MNVVGQSLLGSFRNGLMLAVGVGAGLRDCSDSWVVRYTSALGLRLALERRAR